MISQNRFILFTLTIVLSCIICGTNANRQIRYSPDQYNNTASPTWNKDDHWAQYYTMNDTHSCEQCYNGRRDGGKPGVNCITWDFSQSVCCNHSSFDKYGNPSNKQQQCMDQFKYCSQGLVQDKYKQLTCAMNECPNQYPGVEVVYMNNATDQVWEMNYLETATKCKMVFNASSNSQHSVLNGQLQVEFTEITDALVETFAWPNKIPEIAGSKTHGIMENGIISTPKFGHVIIAPTDWTIYVQYSFGPYAAKIRTRSGAKWWTVDDTSVLKNQFGGLTSTYYQPWIKCKTTEDCKDPKKIGSEQLRFVPQCCTGTSPTEQLEKDSKFCVPIGFENIQLGTSMYQGLDFNCPRTNFGEAIARTQASKLFYSIQLIALVCLAYLH